MRNFVYLLLAIVIYMLLSNLAFAHGMSEEEKQSIIEGGNLAYLWLGATQLNIPLPPSLAPGCSLYSSTDILMGGGLTSSSGAAALGIGLPNDRRLIGVQFANQWWVFDRANNLGIVFTNGGLGTVGG